MPKASWKDIAELIGIAAIVASLIFVGLQMRQAQQIAIAETYQQETASTYARAELAAMNAPLVEKANRGEGLTEAEYFVLSEYATARWNHAFFSRSHQSFLGRNTGGPIASVVLMICENPGLADIWADQSARMVVNSGPDGQLTQFVNEVNQAVSSRCGE